MIALIKQAKYFKEGDPTAKPFRFRFAHKWKVVHPKAGENLYTLFDLDERFIGTVSEKVLLKAKESYEATNSKDQSKGSGKKRVR